MLHRDLLVICELVGTRSMTFVVNLGTCREHIQRLVSALQHVSSSTSLSVEKFMNRVEEHSVLAPFADINISLNPREAFFSNKRKVSINQSLGKTCGELVCAYPPGIPVMIPGEIITDRILDYLLHITSSHRDRGAFQHPSPKSPSSTLITGASDPSLSSIVIRCIELPFQV
ncbi:hypothetical protein ACOSQ4_025980 [Xanthoceras sorbifolium]